MLALIGCLTLNACGDDEPELPSGPDSEQPGIPVNPNQPVKDPDNTITVNLANDGKSLQIGSGCPLQIAINNSNNLYGWYTMVKLVDIGEVAGLGNITEIPSSGWTSEVALMPGHGYVARYYQPYPNSTYPTGEQYARIYVVSYLESTSGGIMGALIKYQCPFEMAISLSATSVNLAAEDAEATLTLRYPTQITVDEKPEWLKVSQKEQALTFTATTNYSATPRTGKVKISNSLGSAEITVTQAASANPLFAAGSGTVADPYQVATAAQLSNVRLAPTAHFVQTADIDLASFIDPAGSGWEPIADFSGTYNGQFHKITSLWINRPTTNYVGLFAKATRQENGEQGLLTGIIVELGERGITGATMTAAICGMVINNVNISQCSVSGNITGDGTTSGIANFSNTNGGVDQCKVIGNVKDSSNNYNASGIAANATVSNSYFCGTVECQRKAYAFGNEATNCYVVGEKPTGKYVNLSSVRNEHCYGWGNVSDEQMKFKSTYEGWDFTTIWQIADGVSYPTLRCFRN